MLLTAISWGYWPVGGLYTTPEMAEKQILTAKALGLNMLNFHRSIGSPVVLEKADELGLLYLEEPGAFHPQDTILHPDHSQYQTATNDLAGQKSSKSRHL